VKDAVKALLLAPALIGFTLFNLLPLLGLLLLSVGSYDGLSAFKLVGLDNFKQLAQDPLFSQALHNSLWFLAVATPLRLGLALLWGVWLARPAKPVAGWLLFIPMTLPDLAVALLALWLLNPMGGVGSSVLVALGYPPEAWLYQAKVARAVWVMVSLWTVGEMALVLAYVRQSYPVALRQMAVLEGASAWRQFSRLTLPWLLPVLLFLACRDAALGLQSSFVTAQIVTKGGPLFSTLPLPWYLYQNGFEYLRFGYAAAGSLIAFGLTTLPLMLFLLWRSSR
jgi:multiple sugar transport system permease protein